MGFEEDEATLQSVAGSLRAAADNLAAGAAEPPVDVRAGAVSSALTAMAAKLAEDTDRFTAQVAGAAATVSSSRESYRNVDQDTKLDMRPPEEKPPPPPPPPGGYQPPMQGPV